MRTRAKLLWSAGALFAGLLLAELVARGRAASVPRPPRAEGELVMRSEDPRLRFENRPGAVQTLVYPDADGPGERRVLAHVNEQGWRGRSIGLARVPGVLRIAVLGDSHTFGHGVADEECWPAVLERELARAGRQVEVLNGGVNGYDAAQAFALLEQRLLAYAPDLVVYGFFCNDLALPASPQGARPELAAATGPPGWLCAHSRLAALVAESFERRARWELWAEAQARVYADDSEPWQRMQRELRSARAQVESRGGHFALLLFPLLVPVRGGLVSTSAHRRLAQYCAGEGIPCLDLEPCFAHLDLDALRVHALDLHAGPEAQRIAGSALARWLLETGRL